MQGVKCELYNDNFQNYHFSERGGFTMKKQPEIHSRVKYFKALMGEGIKPKDRSKARKRKKKR